MSVAELDAGKKHKVDYTSKGPRMLVLRETIDTNPARQQDSTSSIVMNTPCESTVSIEVENVSNVALTDVEVTKQIPKQFSIVESEDSEYELKGKKLSWKIGDLGVGETKIISLNASIEVDNKKPIKSGKTQAKYNANSTLSGVDFNQLDAYCRGFSYMSVNEDERPDNYRCQAVFENRSSFTVDLTKLTVSQTGVDEHLFEVEDVEDDVLPDGRWESGIEVVHSTEKPTFSQELLYTVLPRVSQFTAGEVTLQPLTIDVLEASAEKSYSTGVLRHYRKSELTNQSTNLMTPRT